jgi:hypothetical protein
MTFNGDARVKIPAILHPVRLGTCAPVFKKPEGGVNPRIFSLMFLVKLRIKNF